MTFGDIFSRLFEYLADLSPLRVVHAWELGARLTLGRLRGGTLGPGPHLVIPLAQTLETIDASSTAITTSTQTIESADGHTLAVSVVARYRIVDYARVLATIYEVDQVVEGQVVSSVAGCVTTLDYEPPDDEAPMVSALPEMVYRDLRVKFEAWGLELEDVGVHTLTPVRAWRLID